MIPALLFKSADTIFPLLAGVGIIAAIGPKRIWQSRIVPPGACTFCLFGAGAEHQDDTCQNCKIE